MRPTLGFRLLAVVSAASAWALVAVGGLVRVTESGLGCPDWPLCDGRVVPGDRQAPIIEYSHRATAGLVTALVVATAFWAWRRHRDRRAVLVPALTAGLLVPFQAVLGAIVVWLELPSWVVGVHFVVGMLFLAATVLAAGAAWRGARVPAAGGFVQLAALSAGVGLVLVALGAAVVSAHADDACGRDWPTCNGTLAAGGGDAWLQVAHRSVAYLVAGLALTLALQARRGRGPRLAGMVPLVAVAVQVSIGIALVVLGEESRAHEPLAVLHVAGSGAVWASLVALVSLVGFPRRRPAPVTLAAPAR